MESQITKDYITAMKAKNREKSTVLNFLRAKLKDLAIEKKIDKLDDVDVISVIKKQVKQRQDSIEQFENGGRTDLADKEKRELVILSEYLPEDLSEETLNGFVQEAIKELNASSVKDMGAVMKIVISKSEGRADNKIVSGLVKKALA